MSLWLESLYGYGGGTVDPAQPRERQEAAALHILEHFAMPVPRAWWVGLLSGELAGRERGYADILGSALAELRRVTGPLAAMSTALLVALAFAFEPPDLPASIDEAVTRAAVVLDARPDLEELAQRLEQVRDDR